MPRKTNFSTQYLKTKWLERFLGILAILTIIAAGFVGNALKSGSVEESLPRALPEAAAFTPLKEGIYAGISDDGKTIVGYVAVGEATGYGGPLEVAVAVDLEGSIIGLDVLDHKETPSFFNKVIRHSFLGNLLEKSYADEFELGSDIDGITQATYTSAAIADAVRVASRKIAQNELNLVVPPEPAPKIKFGAPETILILLFAAGYLGRRKVILPVKKLRWIAMLSGMILLGFLYNQPLTLSKINTFLLGFWPEWQTNLYWYLLVIGILFVFTADNRNPYCEWFCPFGAAQECMGAIGGAGVHFSKRQISLLTWLQRIIAWLAIVVALIFRNPGITSYEVFGSLFKLNGSTVGFVIMALVLVASLFVHRFWCRTLCPLRPVEGFIRMVRGWVIELWTKRSKALS